MMDFINDITTESMFDLIKQYYRETTGKEIQIGSDEFAISSVVAYVIGVLVRRFNEQAKQRYLDTATGEYLDALGRTFDISRPEPTHAVCHMKITATSGRHAPVSAAAGTFYVSDSNGVKFKNLEAILIPASSVSENVTFIGAEDKANALSENNLDMYTITNILTPLDGVLSVTNFTSPTGASDEFPHTDDGDDAYRKYISEKRSGVSCGGPAPAYEMRAKETNDKVLDAYCARHDDSCFNEGVARVYVLIDTNVIQGQDYAIIDAITARLNAPDWKPVCDTVSVIKAPMAGYDVGVYVGLRARNAVSGVTKVQADIDAYVQSLNAKLGQCFSISELSRLCQTPDANGVCSEYIRCSNPADNYVSVEKWQHGNFGVEVYGYEIIQD